MAADSTMLRIVNLLIALSLGTQRAQLEQRTGLTWPRPFLLRPLLEETNQVSFPDTKKSLSFEIEKRLSAAIMNTVGNSRYVTRRPSFFFFSAEDRITLLKWQRVELEKEKKGKESLLLARTLLDHLVEFIWTKVGCRGWVVERHTPL